MRIRSATVHICFALLLVAYCTLTGCSESTTTSDNTKNTFEDDVSLHTSLLSTVNTAIAPANMTPLLPVITDISADAFSETLTRAGKPVLVFFYSPDSAPCSWIRPRINSIVADYTNEISCIAVDLSTAGGSAVEAQYNILTVPAFVFFRNTKEKSRLIGSPSRERLTYLIKTHLLQEAAL